MTERSTSKKILNDSSFAFFLFFWFLSQECVCLLTEILKKNQDGVVTHIYLLVLRK